NAASSHRQTTTTTATTSIASEVATAASAAPPPPQQQLPCTAAPPNSISGFKVGFRPSRDEISCVSIDLTTTEESSTEESEARCVSSRGEEDEERQRTTNSALRQHRHNRPRTQYRDLDADQHVAHQSQQQQQHQHRSDRCRDDHSHSHSRCRHRHDRDADADAEARHVRQCKLTTLTTATVGGKTAEQEDASEGGIRSLPLALIVHPLEHLERNVLLALTLALVFTLLALLTGLPVVALLLVVTVPAVVVRRTLSCYVWRLNYFGLGVTYDPQNNQQRKPGQLFQHCNDNSNESSNGTSVTNGSIKDNNNRATTIAAAATTTIEDQLNWSYCPLDFLESYWLAPSLVNQCVLTTENGLTLTELRRLIRDKVLARADCRKFRSRLVRRGLLRSWFWQYLPDDHNTDSGIATAAGDPTNQDDKLSEDEQLSSASSLDHLATDFSRAQKSSATNVKSMKTTTESNQQRAKRQSYFCIDEHVRQDADIASRRQFRERSLALLHTPLQLDRPLWEVRLAVASYSNQCVLIVRCHQCLADGISLVSILVECLIDRPAIIKSTLKDIGMDGAPLMRPRFAGSQAVSTIRACIVGPLTCLLWTIWAFTRRHHNHVKPAQLSPERLAKDTKRFYMSSYDYDKLLRIKQVTRSTVGEVLLAAVCGATRIYLRQHCAIKRPPQLNASLTVDTRRPDDRQPGVKYVLIKVPLPTAIEGAIPRLWETRNIMDDLRTSADPWVMLGMQYFLAQLLPLSWYRAIANFVGHRNSSMCISNIECPQWTTLNPGHLNCGLDAASPTGSCDFHDDMNRTEAPHDVCGTPIAPAPASPSGAANGDSHGDAPLSLCSKKINKIFYCVRPPTRNIPISFNCITYNNRLYIACSLQSHIICNAQQFVRLFINQLNQLSTMLAKRRVPGVPRAALSLPAAPGTPSIPTLELPIDADDHTVGMYTLDHHNHHDLEDNGTDSEHSDNHQSNQCQPAHAHIAGASDIGASNKKLSPLGSFVMAHKTRRPSLGILAPVWTSAQLRGLPKWASDGNLKPSLFIDTHSSARLDCPSSVITDRVSPSSYLMVRSAKSVIALSGHPITAAALATADRVSSASSWQPSTSTSTVIRECAKCDSNDIKSSAAPTGDCLDRSSSNCQTAMIKTMTYTSCEIVIHDDINRDASVPCQLQYHETSRVNRDNNSTNADVGAQTQTLARLQCKQCLGQHHLPSTTRRPSISDVAANSDDINNKHHKHSDSSASEQSARQVDEEFDDKSHDFKHRRHHHRHAYQHQQQRQRPTSVASDRCCLTQQHRINDSSKMNQHNDTQSSGTCNVDMANFVSGLVPARSFNCVSRCDELSNSSGGARRVHASSHCLTDYEREYPKRKQQHASSSSSSNNKVRCGDPNHCAAADNASGNELDNEQAHGCCRCCGYPTHTQPRWCPHQSDREFVVVGEHNADDDGERRQQNTPLAAGGSESSILVIAPSAAQSSLRAKNVDCDQSRCATASRCLSPHGGATMASQVPRRQHHRHSIDLSASLRGGGSGGSRIRTSHARRYPSVTSIIEVPDINEHIAIVLSTTPSGLCVDTQQQHCQLQPRPVADNIRRQFGRFISELRRRMSNTPEQRVETTTYDNTLRSTSTLSSDGQNTTLAMHESRSSL
ncbi:hypothetical protein GZH46_00218, partial [Fragariocoptes setiger]